MSNGDSRSYFAASSAEWLTVKSTASEARVMLRHMFDHATEAIRDVFHIRTSPYAFDIPIAMLRAT